MELTIKNGDLLTLQSEINSVLPKTKNTVLKFYLTALFEKSNDALKPFNKLKEEFIKEYGTNDGQGNISIKQFNSDNIDPRFATESDLTEEFKKYLELINQETTISYKTIPVKEFEKIESDDVYVVLNKFVNLD